jgi:hypothetical protein
MAGNIDHVAEGERREIQVGTLLPSQTAKADETKTVATAPKKWNRKRFLN